MTSQLGPSQSKTDPPSFSHQDIELTNKRKTQTASNPPQSNSILSSLFVPSFFFLCVWCWIDFFFLCRVLLFRSLLSLLSSVYRFFLSIYHLWCSGMLSLIHFCLTHDIVFCLILAHCLLFQFGFIFSNQLKTWYRLRDLCWPENAMEHNGTTKNEGKKVFRPCVCTACQQKGGVKWGEIAQTLYQVSDAQQNQQDRGRVYSCGSHPSIHTHGQKFIIRRGADVRLYYVSVTAKTTFFEPLDIVGSNSILAWSYFKPRQSFTF